MATATSSQDPSLPDPHEWHHSRTVPCPVCGLPKFVGERGHQFEHRRLQPKEHETAVYALRRRRGRPDIRFLLKSGRPAAPEGPKQNSGNRSELRGKRGEYGVSATVRDRIIRATTLLANGKTRLEVSEILKVKPAVIADYQFCYPGLWQASYDSAMAAVREAVRQLAGTPDILADLDAYLLTASRAERWSQDRGEPLFDRGEATTLPQFFERHYLPLRPQGKNSVEQFRITLRRWAAITGDPALTEITADTLALFRDALAKMRGLNCVGYISPNTVIGKLKKIQALLDKAGPSGHRNRDALGLLGKVPWVKPPRGIRRAVRIVSEETINRFYLGCIAAEQPRSPDFKPAAWWRGLVVFVYNTGLRRGTTFKIRLRWIDWKRRCIAIPPEVTKTGMEQIIPLNQTVVDHLQAIRGEREYLFDWGRPIDRYFYSFFHKLQDQCGIAKTEQFAFHQLRKTCATVLWEHNPQVAQFALGHTTLGTTAGYYVRGAGMLARAAEQMPQPAAFCNGHAPESAPVNGRKDRP